MTTELIASALKSAIDSLSTKEEQELFSRWQQHGDRSAQERLSRSQLRYVVSRAFHFAKTTKCDIDELFLTGCEGLAKAIDRFDIGASTRLNTYVAHYVNRHMLCEVENRGTPLAGARTARTTMYFVLRKAADALSKSDDKEATIAQLCATEPRLAKCSPERLKNLLLVHCMGLPISLDAPLSDDDDSGNRHDLVADLSTNPEGLVAIAEERSIAREKIKMAMMSLPERHQMIIRDTILCLPGNEITLTAVGEKLGISRERARQLQASALKRLKVAIRAPKPLPPTKERPWKRRFATGPITHNGVTMTLQEWADRLGVKYATLYQRRIANMPLDQMLTGPMKGGGKIRVESTAMSKTG